MAGTPEGKAMPPTRVAALAIAGAATLFLLYAVYAILTAPQGDGTGFHILGVGPLNSARAAEWMRAHVPGVRIPDALIARLKGAADAKAEGRVICVEMIRHIRGLEGVSGVHIMAIGHPRAVGEIADAAAVGPRHRQSAARERGV